jgi:ApaG protein
VRISVQPFFLEDQSDRRSGAFVWAYRVEISTWAGRRCSCFGALWLITDGQGRTHATCMATLVGALPVLGPRRKLHLHVRALALPTPRAS